MSDFRIHDQPLPGVFVLDCPHFVDHRGDFTKLFHADAFLAHGIAFTPAESFLTRSKAGVLRGMHYQADIASHDKLVSCIKGRVLDVVVDVRSDSIYFNKPYSIELSESTNIAVLVGKGYAHGFLSLSNDNWMIYSASSIHCPALDRGVLWSSIAIDWPCLDPILSERDKEHPAINALL